MALVRVRLTFPRISRDSYESSVDGVAIDQDAWLQSQARQERLDKQSEILVERLFQSGDEGIYRPKENWLSFVSGSGKVRPLVSSRYSNRNVIPTTQQRNSRSYLRDLRCFTENATKYARMLVATEGERVPIEEFPSALAAHTRRVSKQLLPYLKAQQCPAFFVKSEFPCKFDEEKGRFTYHIHTHILYEPKVILDNKSGGWGKLMKECRARMGGRHIHDAGRIRNLNECTKYCTKPDELLELPPAELYQLSQALNDAKILRPVGEFRKFRGRLSGDKVEVRQVGEPENRRWVEVEKADGRRLEVQYAKKSKSKTDIVLGVKLGAFTSNICERHYLVMNYAGDFEALLSKRGLTRDSLVSPKSCDDYKVHNSTITVLDPISFSSWPAHPAAPPGVLPPGEPSFLIQKAQLEGAKGV